MRLYSVYCHTSPSNKRYVGVTSTDPYKRWNNGRGYDGNTHFANAIRKYGWSNFRHEILYSDLSLEEAYRIERKLISEWHLTDISRGYNIREGGDGPHAESSRQKMSKSRIGNTNCVNRTISDDTKQKISSSLKEYYKTHDGTMKARHHSEETINILRGRTIKASTRAKMSENHSDVSGSKNPSARAVVQMLKDGTIVERYSYATEAANNLNLDLSSIIKCCRGKLKTCGGYVWKYGDSLTDNPERL